MISTNIIRLIRFSNSNNLLKLSALKSNNIKTFSLNSKLWKENSEKENSKKEGSKTTERQLSEAENQLKRIMSEYVDPSSPFTSLIEKLVSKPWITFFGEKTKVIPIKERKETETKKVGTFKLAFDLAGFKQEEIHVVLSDKQIYIEAQKQEIGADGSKFWREFSYECPVPKDVNFKSVNAYLDADGLLLIEGDLPKDTVTKVKDEAKEKS